MRARRMCSLRPACRAEADVLRGPLLVRLKAWPGIPLGFTLPNFGSVAVSGNNLVVQSSSEAYNSYQLASSRNNVYELYDAESGHIISSPSAVASNGDFSQIWHYSS
jgi:hypothetical protein